LRLMKEVESILKKWELERIGTKCAL
jgi:hypothetical protein